MLHLRPHQVEIINKLNEGFEQGHRSQLIWGVTGLGKTEIAMAIMQAAANQYKRCAMVMDRVVLVEQTSMRLNKYKIDHGVLQSNHWRYRPSNRIQICSAQTLESRNHFPDIDLLIVDECHTARKKINKYIKDHPNVKVVGLTATPFTKGLGEIYTNVVAGPTYEDIISNGWLAPLKVFIAKEIDMSGAKKVAGEWSADEVTSRGMQIVGDVVSEWVKKTHEIFGAPRKTIVFCAGVDHGRELQKQFKEAGYNFVSISYKEDDDFKRMTLEDFSRPDTQIHGLIATDILTKGFDCSDVMIGVSARPFSKSFSSHVQQLGRIMRPHEGKEFGLLLDHSGNYLRFRDDWDRLYTDGVTELPEGGEKAKKEPTEREKKEAKCPKCAALWNSKTDVCSNCGFVRVKLSTVIAIPGEMQELQAANKKLKIDNQTFYSELLYYARTKGFKDGWCAYKYKEKFGYMPKGLNSIPKQPSFATLNWIKSRAIAYAKSRSVA